MLRRNDDVTRRDRRGGVGREAGAADFISILLVSCSKQRHHFFLTRLHLSRSFLRIF